jgi:hypothetical protein
MEQIINELSLCVDNLDISGYFHLISDYETQKRIVILNKPLLTSLKMEFIMGSVGIHFYDRLKLFARVSIISFDESDNETLDIVNRIHLDTIQENGKFDVAISFAGTERGYAEIISEILRHNGVNVFYDKFEVSNLFGKNLIEEFAEIYGNKADFCIILVSEEYSNRAYTNFERRNALDKFVLEKPDYILPIKFDNSWIKGLPKSTAYLDIDNFSIVEICKIIIAKLNPDYIEGNLLALPYPDKLLSLERGKPKKGEIAQMAIFESIKHTLSNYKYFAHIGNGSSLVNLLSASTIEWYDKICIEIRSAEKQRLFFLPFEEVFNVLMIRYMIYLGKIDTNFTNGKDLISSMTSLKMFGYDSMSTVVLSKIDIISDKIVNVFQKNSNITLPFHHEEGIWKMDLCFTLKRMYSIFSTVYEKENLPKMEFIKFLFKVTYGVDDIEFLYDTSLTK